MHCLLCSGQSSFPNKLDLVVVSNPQLLGSGQSSFPNKLDYLADGVLK